MYAGVEPWYPSVLDVGHDDYFDAPVPRCLDLATSGWLAGPALANLRLSPRRFKARRGTTVRYTAAQPVTTMFTVWRTFRGRARWKRLRGGLSHAGREGANRVRFSGRLRGRALRPGHYKLTGIARSATGVTGRAVTAPFRIVSPGAGRPPGRGSKRGRDLHVPSPTPCG
jgi:hypothetical protein